MTQKEAKEISLEVWRYLAEHPWIRDKSYLPKDLYEKVKDLQCMCPLCELFHDHFGYECPGCPLSGEGYFCYSPGRPYRRWANTGIKETRGEAAEEIVRLIEAWEVV
jgi:hypothetical protein